MERNTLKKIDLKGENKDINVVIVDMYFKNMGRSRINNRLWKEYTEHKQTYKELGEKYGKDIRTIRKELDKVVVKKYDIQAGETVLIMDTTYFGRSFGIMVFRSSELKKNLLWKEVQWESLEEYKSGIAELENKGWKIKAVVCDGKRGLLNMKRAVQMRIFIKRQS